MEEEKMSSCSPPLSTSFSSSSSSTTTTTASQNSRWNPTKEQISILEGLYWQGIRTPTADQIQQITGKLREFGAIEGKNVFYWFQNHKARQRQKQKQESFAYFSHLLHRRPQPPSPPPPISYNNVVCAPFCLQVSQVAGIGLYKPQYPLMSKLQRMEMDSKKPVSREQCCYETLQLFPQHPTGILEEKPSGSSLTSACMGTECNKEFHHQEKEEEEDQEEEQEEEQEEGCESFPIFNFFAC